MQTYVDLTLIHATSLCHSQETLFPAIHQYYYSVYMFTRTVHPAFLYFSFHHCRPFLFIHPLPLWPLSAQSLLASALPMSCRWVH